MRSHRYTATFAAIAIVAAGLAWSAAPARADTVTVPLGGSGTGEYTRLFIDEIPRPIDLPEIREDGLGKVQFHFQLGTTTRAQLGVSELLQVTTPDPDDLRATHAVIVRTLRGLPSGKLTVTTRPFIRLNVDYQRFEHLPFACDLNYTEELPPNQFAREYDPEPGFQGEPFCAYLEITADDLNAVFDTNFPEVFTLIDQIYNPRYSGSVVFHNEAELFEIKVCQILGNYLPAAKPILGDRCAVKVRGTVDVELDTPEQLGFLGYAQLCSPGTLAGGTVPCLQLRGEEKTIDWPGYVQVSTPYTVPCVDGPLSLRMRDLSYRSIVRSVALGVEAAFNVRLRASGPGRDLFSFQLPVSVDLLEGTDIDVDVRDPDPLDRNPVIALGDVTNAPPQVIVRPPFVAREGTPFTLVAETKLDGQPRDDCTPDADIVYTWERAGEVVTKTGDPSFTATFSDNHPATHMYTFRAQDASGNVRDQNFQVSVENVAPVAFLSAAQPAVAGRPSALTADATDPGTLDLLTYTWTFGDGESSVTPSTAARSDSRTHVYTDACLCTVGLGVHDGEDGTFRTLALPVVNDGSKLTGTGRFVAEANSVAVVPGSTYEISSKVQQDRTVASGRFTASFLKSGSRVPSLLDATAFDWLIVTYADGRVILQGSATVDGQPGWRFRFDQAIDPRTGVPSATVRVWRPPFRTLENPDYVMGGPMTNRGLRGH